ncbi:MAG: nucleotidyltransferase domain-containing protein [Verrucomicrobia bacterium]|nr:nucleotidyltransferase domain-containing protein [Verrucomicrobiota bacterium]
MSASISTILAELKAGLEAIYHSRLRGCYLFGSYARGEADAESDVDVLVVLDCCDRYAEEIDRTGALVSEVSLKHGVSISRVLVSERDWRETETPFLANARAEAVAA